MTAISAASSAKHRPFDEDFRLIRTGYPTSLDPRLSPNILKKKVFLEVPSACRKAVPTRA